MLGLRTAIKEGIEASPAEFLYGKTFRLPDEFLTFAEFVSNRQIFIEEFQRDNEAAAANTCGSTKQG